MQKLIILIGALVFIQCKSENIMNHMAKDKGLSANAALALEEEIEYVPPPESPDHTSAKKLNKEAKLIKTGRIEIESLELSKSKLAIDKLVHKYQAYYEHENYVSSYGKNTYNLTLRIPSNSFDSIYGGLLSGIGLVKSKFINVKDVSEEYVDLNIRLESNLAYLVQYREILKKAKTIEEILEVREIIRRIEEEIESKKGRLRFLDDQVGFSTLSIQLYEVVDAPIQAKHTFLKKIAIAFKSGVDGFLGFLIAIVYVWPFVVLLIILVLMRKRIWRKISMGRGSSSS